jgi:hypothetical protein
MQSTTPQNKYLPSSNLCFTHLYWSWFSPCTSIYCSGSSRFLMCTSCDCYLILQCGERFEKISEA